MNVMEPQRRDDRRECCTLEDLSRRLKPRYRRLALIANRRHLELLDPADEDTLVVCCDWLLWQQELAAGRHIAYYELEIRAWDAPDPMASELFIRANDWIPDDGGDDPTEFRHVSLGRSFSAEMSMAMMNHYRLERALRKLIERFRPEEIWFFDFIYDVNVLKPSLRKLLVEEAAREHGVAFVDRGGEAPDDDDHFAETVYARNEHGPAARVVLSVYAWLLQTATRIRCALSGRGSPVLVLVNANLAAPLVRNFTGGLIPAFVGRTIPRRPGLLWRCLRLGVLLVALEPVRLSAADADRLGAIRDALEEHFSRPAPGRVGFAHAYVRREILDTGRLRDMAREVVAAERLLDWLRPRRVVVDGVRNARPRSFIELARLRNIAVDYIWHSPLAPKNMKMDALGGDPRFPRCVNRCLTWGRINDEWLDRVEGPPSRVRVGSPLRDKYVGREWRQPPEGSAAAGKNVLLLQYTFIVSDLAGIITNMFENFVNTVRELQRLGYANIRYKLHPGRGRWKQSYFEEVADYFGLDCEIVKSEPFQDCVAWADVVIGPAQSGATFETLAAGKPYYAFMLPPFTLDPGYYRDFPLMTAIDQLPRALSRNIEAEGRSLLDDFYGVDEIPDPSKRFWDVLAEDAT